MGGTVTDVVHGGRFVYVEFYKGGSRLFKRADVQLDRTDEYEEEKKHEEEEQGKDQGKEGEKEEELEGELEE